MAWKLTVGGVDKTSSVESTRTTQIERVLNERSRMQFSTRPGYVPARFAEVVAYKQDGVTPLFGGVVTGRGSADFGDPGANPFYTDNECGDFFTYFDWAFVSLSYAADVSLETVMNDIVAALPASFGITVDAAQVTGPLLAAFTWERKRASDAARELSDRTGYVGMMSPLKAWKMFIPGTDPAPFALTDGNPHCRSFHWRDSDRIPANTVTVIAGPSGAALATQRWVADGIATSWVTDIAAADPPPPLVQIDNGVTPYLATVGTGGMYEWDTATHTLSLGTDTLPAAGTTIVLGPSLAAGDPFETNGFTASYPFTVTETTGATPAIEFQQAYPDVVTFAQAREIALGLLAQLDQQPREIDVLSVDAGWAPGQALSVALTARLTASFVITGDTITLTTDLFWVYQFGATESATYQGSYLDQWRALTGGSSSGVSSVSGGGGGGTSIVTALTPVYMGGATATGVTNPTTKKLIPNASEYFAAESFTGRLRVRIRARDAAVGVKAIISDGTTDTATSVVTSQTFTPVNVIVPIIAGHTYRVYLQNTATGDAFCEYAQLEAA